MDGEGNWLTERKVVIKVEGNDVGWLTLQYIRVRNASIQHGPGSFWGTLEYVSEELGELAYSFDDDGKLLQSVADQGTGCWRRGEFDPVLVVMPQIVIEEALRGQGIGSWAMQHIFSLPSMRNINFLFAQPGIINRLEPPRADPWSLFTPAEKAARALKHDRIDNFHRKAGFRRLGHSYVFCLAKNADHPSRAVPIDDDAPYKPRPPPSTEEERIRAILMKGLQGYMNEFLAEM
ncbi:hypothetical protein BV25DRAFT_1575920 [Artomyces pyxidatus]|uniref:Uncharacterized protein n=1 Tax=Artomyces pyxidatus TaxID=48021 RepID=A0ACB8SJ24_9AGAM|nr:hypothetical protein BV25DRAFT_1575920 [Artomyces pyxidatus]